jgi:O-methyltransferase domain
MRGEVEPAAQLWAMADLVTPMAVRVAATLRIADHIAQGSTTAGELAEATKADADTLDRLLKHLAAVSVLDRDQSGRYRLTPLGDVLHDDDPRGLRTRLDLEGAIGHAELSFVALLHAVRTGEPAFVAQFGRSFWDDLAANPARSATFDAEMGADVARWAPAILSAYDWGALGHIVDVGGGDGTLLAALLNAHPALRGTVVDLPRTAEAARTAFTAAGLADRADVGAGSFFDPLPAGAAGYLLTAIVHDWDDEPARAILRRCAEAAGAEGRVFVIEKIGADGETPSTEVDLRLLAYLGGRERSLDELVRLTEDAGCRVAAVHRARAISIVELAAR